MASNEKYNLPRALDNDQEAAVLYSVFREKSLNPHSWSQKMRLWEQILSEAALERNIISFDVNSLTQLFERKGIKPKCLGTVIEELQRSGQIKSVEDYKPSNGWLTWAYNKIVIQPLSWGVGHIWGLQRKESDVYVWPAVVKKICQEVTELYHADKLDAAHVDSLMSLPQLRALCQSLISTDQDFNIILFQLERDRKIALSETPDKEIVIKFCKPGESTVNAIKDTDLQIYEIQMALKKLEEAIEILSGKVERHLNDARTHVRANRKTAAKHCLRQKKTTERLLDKKFGAISMLTDILHKIEEASTNEKVIKACAVGAAAMKNLMREVTVEGADAAIDDLKAAVETQEEISQYLCSFNDTQEDDDQLELDLDLLLNDSIRQAQSDHDLDAHSVSKKGRFVNEESDTFLRESAKGNKSEHLSNQEHIITGINALAVDDLGLPNVPSSSPSQSSLPGRSKDGTSAHPMTS